MTPMLRASGNYYRLTMTHREQSVEVKVNISIVIHMLTCPSHEMSWCSLPASPYLSKPRNELVLVAGLPFPVQATK